MKSVLLYMLILSSSMHSHTIFDFNKNADIRNWRIVDDVVMGGRSSGNFSLSPEGHGLFEGKISLKNNGGFSSVRYNFDQSQIGNFSTIALKIKGDRKKYQFRIKSNNRDYYSYIYQFSTSGEWEEIQIPLKDMYPSFRGRKLNQPNFAKDNIQEIAFLIGNKSEEQFRLLIDTIELK